MTRTRTGVLVGATFFSAVAALLAGPRAARGPPHALLPRRVLHMCRSDDRDQGRELLITRSCVDALVAKRSALRGQRQWGEADKVKEELEGFGVKLQDRQDGLTDWIFWTPPTAKGGSSPSVSAAESVPQLARLAAEAPEDVGEVLRLTSRIKQLLDLPPPHAPMLLGRVAADAAFDLALAGSDDAQLLEQLAALQAIFFCLFLNVAPPLLPHVRN